jgi:hypothetical protein
MQTGVKPKATDDPHDFVVIPSDQVQVAPPDAEITGLLRAAARHQSETGARATSDPSVPSSVPMVDTTFRATAVNDDVARRGPSFGRRAMRAVIALLLTLGIGAAALTWQTFGYAAKKALFTWAPKLAIAASLRYGLAKESTSSDDPAGAAQAQTAVPAQSVSDSDTPATVAADTAAPASDTAQQLQSMARDLANANQEVETLKATIAELKASQQQMSRDLAKVSEQAAKAKIAAARPAAPAHRPAPPVYSPAPTAYSPPPASAPPPAYRPVSSYPATQAAAAPAAQPYVSQPQPYAPPPIPLQPEPGSASAPRPPMPVQ